MPNESAVSAAFATACRRGATLALSRGVNLRSAIVFAVCALAVTSVSAQTSAATLRGAVRDPYGVVPAAEVTLIHEGTNAQRSAITNGAGEYAFKKVPPGTYTVRVALPGFKISERTRVRVATPQSALVDFSLEIAADSYQIPEGS